MKKKLKVYLLSIVGGSLAGAAASLFLFSLEYARQLRTQHLWLLYLLPLAGVVIGFLYSRYGQVVARGNNLIIDEIHRPLKKTPGIMAPLVFICSFISHLVGASVGREGAAVQMGASLTDQLSRWFALNDSERRSLLIAGTGAGFGAALGTPIAGILFGMEVIHVGKLKVSALFESVLASFAALFITKIFGLHHAHFKLVVVPEINFNLITGLFILSGLCALLAWFFVFSIHQLENLSRKYLPNLMLRGFVGGVLILFFIWLEGSSLYSGLGITEIQKAFIGEAEKSWPLLKGFFTILSVSFGFKGGEFVPLVYMGATTGSLLANFLNITPSLFAALGFATIFAGAANTPIACMVMAVELFGFQVAPFVIITCFLSYQMTPHHGLYGAQVTTHEKKFYSYFQSWWKRSN